MRTRLVILACSLAVVTLGLEAAETLRAQGFSSGDIERGLQPGPYTPYDNAPWSHRSAYYVGPVFYFGLNTQKLAYLDYLDRVDRAERFGYRMPPNPWKPRFQPPPCDCRPAR